MIQWFVKNKITKRVFYNWAILSLVTIMAGVSGCGNKSALYLPTEKSATKEPVKESMKAPAKGMETDPASVTMAMPKNLQSNPQTLEELV
jgi:predicted small lipoprotein YifL